MATTLIVPRATGEGTLGTDSLYWSVVRAKEQYLTTDIVREIATGATTSTESATLWSKTLGATEIYEIRAWIVGKNTTEERYCTFGIRTAVKKEDSGDAAFIGNRHNQVVNLGKFFTDEGATATFALDTDDIQLLVYGMADVAISWKALIEWIKI